MFYYGHINYPQNEPSSQKKTLLIVGGFYRYYSITYKNDIEMAIFIHIIPIVLIIKRAFQKLNKSLVILPFLIF